MINIINNLVFLIISIYILIKTLGYAFYEIKELKNTYGGVTIICFSILVVIFANLVVLRK